MEAGTQSVFLVVWALFWMLALSLTMVHPMFRATRIQIRRSLRLKLNRWRMMRHRMRGRMLRCQGYCLIRVSKAFLWLARCLEKGVSPPFWVRLPMRLSGRSLFLYLAFHVVGRQPLTWQDMLIYLTMMEALDALHNGWKRRKQRLQETDSGDGSSIKPAQEQRAKP